MSDIVRRHLCLVLGPMLWLLAIWVIPDAYFAFEARSAIGTILWMAAWWITLPVATGVTAFLPIVVNAFTNMMPMDDVLANYGSETVMLLLGADLISVSWEMTGFDKRVSRKALCLIGPSLTQQIISWFMIAAVLSMFLPNVVVCAMLIPISLSMLESIGQKGIKEGKIAPLLCVAIVWGAGVGGMGTPLGGAMNLVAVGYIEQITGTEFLYVDWFTRMLPIMFIIMITNIICMMIMKPKGVKLKGSSEYFKKLYAELPPMSRDEYIGLTLFALAIFLSFGRSLYDEILPGLKPAYSFLTLGLLTFVISRKNGKPLMTWHEAEKKIFWGMIFMFAGGMAAGGLLTNTGATESIVELISHMSLTGGIGTILAFVVCTMLLADVSNNTTAAVIAVPIVVSVIDHIGGNSVPYIFVMIAAFNCAYMLPTTIRAIPIEYGLSPIYLFKRGLFIGTVTAMVIAICGYIMTFYIPFFGTL